MKIILEKLEKKYNNDDFVFKNINYEFEKGIYIIKGTNGIGKTTLLRV